MSFVASAGMTPAQQAALDLAAISAGRIILLQKATGSIVSGTLTAAYWSNYEWGYIQAASGDVGVGRVEFTNNNIGPYGNYNSYNYDKSFYAGIRMLAGLTLPSETFSVIFGAASGMTSEVPSGTAYRLAFAGRSGDTPSVQLISYVSGTPTASAIVDCDDSLYHHSYGVRHRAGAGADLVVDGAVAATLSSGIPSGEVTNKACSIILTSGSGSDAVVARFTNPVIIEL